MSVVIFVILGLLLLHVAAMLIDIAMRERERRRWSPTRDRLRQYGKAVERPPADH